MAAKLKFLEALLFTLFYISAVNGALFPHSSRGLIEHATVIAHDHLYISGGTFTHPTGAYWGKIHHGTSKIDLTYSWGTDRVKAESLSDVFSFEQTLFYNRYDDDLGRFGGLPPSGLKISSPGLSVLSLQDDPRSQWSTPLYQPPSSITPTSRGLVARTPDAVYILGGSYYVEGRNESWGAPGLLKFNYMDHTWSNISSNKYTSSFYTEGAAVFVPTFGKEGVILFLGGLTYPSNESIISRDQGTFQSLAELLVYDIASREFYMQSASSFTERFSRPRHLFCAVGAEDSEGGGYDIFMFGGRFEDDNLNSTIHRETSNKLFDAEDVWILSLPSFQWLQVGASGYIRGLAGHTCEVVGKRYMAVIGGVPVVKSVEAGALVEAEAPDEPLIFNMARHVWTGWYDANGAAYSRAPCYMRAPCLRKSVEQKPFPSHWNDSKLEQIFAPSKYDKTSQEADQLKGGNAGLIAGAVFGPASAIIFAVGALRCFLRRRRRKMRHGYPRRDGHVGRKSY